MSNWVRVIELYGGKTKEYYNACALFSRDNRVDGRSKRFRKVDGALYINPEKYYKTKLSEKTESKVYDLYCRMYDHFGRDSGIAQWLASGDKKEFTRWTQFLSNKRMNQRKRGILLLRKERAFNRLTNQ